MTIIDVSKWDRTIDWDVARLQGGVSGVISRATVGTDGDAFCTANIRRAADSLIAERAIYGALIPWLRDDTEFQAEALAAAFDGLNDYLSGFEAPAGNVKIIADVERNPSFLPQLVMQQRVKKYLLEIKRLTGEIASIYTAPGLWNGMIGQTAWAGEFQLWVAHYGVAKPTLPWGWKTYWLWQYTDKGTCPGISVRAVDLNRRAP